MLLPLELLFQISSKKKYISEIFFFQMVTFQLNLVHMSRVRTALEQHFSEVTAHPIFTPTPYRYIRSICDQRTEIIWFYRNIIYGKYFSNVKEKLWFSPWPFDHGKWRARSITFMLCFQCSILSTHTSWMPLMIILISIMVEESVVVKMQYGRWSLVFEKCCPVYLFNIHTCVSVSYLSFDMSIK